MRGIVSGKHHLELCSEIAENAETGDMGNVYSLHLKMIFAYYNDVLRQANASFVCAVVIAVMGFMVLVWTIKYAVSSKNATNTNSVGAIGLVSGGLIEFTSAIVFFVYRRSTEQFSTFHVCLERTNRYLIASRLNDSISNPDQKDKVKRELACIIANAPMIGGTFKESNSTQSASPSGAAPVHGSLTVPIGSGVAVTESSSATAVVSQVQ